MKKKYLIPAVKVIAIGTECVFQSSSISISDEVETMGARDQYVEVPQDGGGSNDNIWNSNW